MRKALLTAICICTIACSLRSQSVAFTSWTSFDNSNNQDLYWNFDADSMYFSLDNINWTAVSAYWETGPAFQILDSPSTGQCADTGDYLRVYSGDTLWLNYVNDTCSDRILYLGTHYFINQLTSVGDEIDAAKISISPNPASGQFTVNSSTTPEKIILVDVTGRVVYEEKPSSNSTTIYLEQAPPGIYLVKAYFGDHYSVKRVVIR